MKKLKKRFKTKKESIAKTLLPPVPALFGIAMTTAMMPMIDAEIRRIETYGFLDELDITDLR